MEDRKQDFIIEPRYSFYDHVEEAGSDRKEMVLYGEFNYDEDSFKAIRKWVKKLPKRSDLNTTWEPEDPVLRVRIDLFDTIKNTIDGRLLRDRRDGRLKITTNDKPLFDEIRDELLTALAAIDGLEYIDRAETDKQVQNAKGPTVTRPQLTQTSSGMVVTVLGKNITEPDDDPHILGA